jgi:hypothetical protein
MQFLDLEHYQRQLKHDLPPKLKHLVPALNEYFATELGQRRDVNLKRRKKDIVPVTLAKKLSIDEGLALALLMISENAGVVTPHYHVLCPDSEDFLGAFKSISELPKTILCPFHDAEKVHDIDEYHVDLVFHFTPKALRKYVKAERR